MDQRILDLSTRLARLEKHLKLDAPHEPVVATSPMSSYLIHLKYEDGDYVFNPLGKVELKRFRSRFMEWVADNLHVSVDWMKEKAGLSSGGLSLEGGYIMGLCE